MNVISDVDELHPIAKRVALHHAERLDKLGLKTRFHETFREAKRAIHLKNTGASKNGLDSLHRFRVAYDLIHATLYFEAEPEFWTTTHHEGDIIGLHDIHFYVRLANGQRKRDRNGNFIKVLDSPHFQLVKFEDQAKFRKMNMVQVDDYLAANYPKFV